ncbi:hypothetical protein [Cupriavidus plantarum]|uniref:hypothetical protein n=1 Tax=Cupriavidus plantarum TaxID=942865 RepID=UPI00339D43C6
METKFTPGPLRYYKDHNGRFHVCAGGTDDLASLFHPAINPGTMEGNARLFAASPDLLSELQAAHLIIRNALNLMSPSAMEKWAKWNERDGVIGEGTTRAFEREAAITAALGAKS